MVKRYDTGGAILVAGEAIISIVVGLAGIRISYYGEFGSAAVLFVLVLFVASSVAVGETSRAAKEPQTTAGFHVKQRDCDQPSYPGGGV